MEILENGTMRLTFCPPGMEDVEIGIEKEVYVDFRSRAAQIH